MFDLGRADQREIVLVGNDEDDAPIPALKDIRLIMARQARHDDMRPAHEPQPVRVAGLFAQIPGPRPGGVHQLACAMGFDPPVAFDVHFPMRGMARGRDDLGACEDATAAHHRVARIECDEAGIVHPCVGIFEPGAERRLEQRARRMAPQVDPFGARQTAAP